MKNWFKKHPNIVIFVAYIFLTLIFTVPVIFEINKKIPGSHDAFEIFSHSFYYESNTIAEYFKNPLLIFDFKSYLLILHKIIGEPLAYNIIWFLSFILAAFGAYLLCEYLTRNKIASFIGGFIFAFSPLHFGYSLAFGGGTHIEFIPFFVLFFIKYLRSSKLKYLTFALLFFAFIIINEPHFAAYTILFSAITGIYYLFKNKLHRNRKFIVHASAILIIGTVFALWAFLPLIKVSISGQNYLNPGIQAAITFSNDVVALFTPGNLHPLWGGFFYKNIMNKFTGNAAEWSIYLGFTSLFFLLYAMISLRKEKQLSFWLIIFLFFFIISLGPFLHFFGTIEPKIPMPYLLIYKYIPFFENIRAVGRAFIYASLALAVLVTFGIKFFLEQKVKSKKRFYFGISIVIFFLTALEYWATPITSSTEIPKIFREFAESKNENFAILQPQIHISHGVASYSGYYNAIHDKKLLGEHHFARENPNLYKFEQTTPAVNNLLYAIPFGYPTSDFIVHDYSKISNFIFNVNNIKYVVLYKKFVGIDITFKNFIEMKRFIENAVGAEKYLEDKETIVYKIKGWNGQHEPLILERGEGWSKTEQIPTGEFVSYIEQQNASLIIKNYTKDNKKIKIVLFPRQANDFRKLKIDFNEHKKEYFINADKQPIVLYLDNIKPGDNVVKLVILDHEGREINVSKYDTVYFSVAYEEIETIARPELFDKFLSDKTNNNVLQIPASISDNFERESPTDKRIIDYGEFQSDWQCRSLKFNRAFVVDGLRLIFENSDLNQLQNETRSCLEKLNIKSLIIHKEFLQPNELSNLLSFISVVLPSKKVLMNNENLLAYQIGELIDEKKATSWTADFEDGDFNEWDIKVGAENEVQITNDTYSGKGAAKLSFAVGQAFNGLVKNFDSPVEEATVEGWIKINDWARGFVDLYFDFIYDKKSYFGYKGLYTLGNYVLFDYYQGRFVKKNNIQTFGHNLPIQEWMKVKIKRTRDGTFSFYENNQKIFSYFNKKHPAIYGFKIGVGGCCKESNIQLLVDDFEFKIEKNNK